MPNLNFSVPHKLSRDEALLRVKEAFEKIKAAYQSEIKNLTEQWNGQVGEFECHRKGTFSFSNAMGEWRRGEHFRQISCWCHQLQGTDRDGNQECGGKDSGLSSIIG